jgi:hypothetical protein
MLESDYMQTQNNQFQILRYNCIFFYFILFIPFHVQEFELMERIPTSGIDSGMCSVVSGFLLARKFEGVLVPCAKFNSISVLNLYH